jgi:hypothetical protein
MVAEDSHPRQVAGMPLPFAQRPLALAALLLAAIGGAVACAGGEAAPASERRVVVAAPRPALPAVIDSVAAESLAVDSAMRGLGADPGHAIFSCFVGDSAVYANLAQDTFGDTVGVRITLWHAGDGVDGSRADVGDPAPPLPLSAVRLFAADSIQLDFPATMDPGETSRFIGRVSCDRLWGKQRNYRDAPTRPVQYGRVRELY